MKTRELFSKLRRMRIIVVFLALVMAYGAVSYSPQAATPNNLHEINLGGVTGTTNNTILAYGRYLLIAPFWPSTGIGENGDIDPALLDNDSVYMIDTKKPDSPPIRKRLKSLDSKSVYFPSKIAFDPNTNNLYVRGTRFAQNADGDVTTIDAFAYVRLIPGEEKGKADFENNVITFDIQGVSGPFTGDAPLDFAFSGNGDLMVFTNGSSVFSFTLAEGYINRVEVVPPADYSSNNSISFLDVDPVTNIVSVCANEKWVGRDKVTRVSSQLSFYKLGALGGFDLVKRTSGFSSDGTAVVEGSNISVVSDNDSPFALFATNDGSVCTVDLSGGSNADATINRLVAFPELALASVADSSPLLVHYESAKRLIGVVKPGFTVQITRPLNGRPGRITRPINLHIASENPVLAIAKLSKKYKVTGSVSFSQDFVDEGGLANLVIGEDSQWLISTYSGKLYTIGIGADLAESDLKLIGTLGSSIDRFDYYTDADRTNVVAINSFTLDADGISIASPGSVVYGKLSDLEPESVLQALLPTASMLGKSTPAIRRPCNLRR